MVNLAQTVADIRSLKIQGATNITKVSLNLLLNLPETEIPEAIDQLLAARPTEPLLQNCLGLVKIKGKPVIKPLLTRLEDIKEEVIKTGLHLIKNNQTILTHCHSSTVVAILRRAKEKGWDFKVYLTETRPVFQGRITAKELVDAGISATMITDSEAAFLVSRQDKRDIDLVILGADAITPDGGAFNKVGSYGIALSAHEAKIPVYVAAKLLKFSSRQVVIEERESGEVWRGKPKNLKIFNPAFDFVPPKLITGWVTEFGLVKPDKVRNWVKKNYPWIIKSSSNKFTSSSTSPYRSYLHLGQKIDSRAFILAQYCLGAGRGEDFQETAGGVAAESSVGTWTQVETEVKSVFERLHARVLAADKKTGFLEIAYPLELFEPANLPQLLSSVAGNVFGLKEVSGLKLLDLKFPEKYVQKFLGPAQGLPGIKKITGIFSRPLVGCIVKPKLGLDPKAQARVAEEVFEGGVDFVKDDENLTSQFFNPFAQRVKEITKILKESKFRHKIYAFNVTAETEEMLVRAKLVERMGGNCVMVDFLTAGLGAVQTLRRKTNLIIHAHRAMHAALDRNPRHGISTLVLSKLARLAGVDSLHTGTVVGKMEGGVDEVTSINDFLVEPWYGLKPVLPVASGGLHPGLIPDLIKILGTDVLLNFGGGIHGHPQGSRAGARAVLAAVEATQAEIPLWEYAKTREELAVALEHWGSQSF